VQLLEAHTRSQRLIDLVLASQREFDRRKELYNKLSDVPLGTLLGRGGPSGEPTLYSFGMKGSPPTILPVKTSGNDSFLANWARLVDLRNHIVHGKDPEVTATDRELLIQFERTGFVVFAGIHNDVIRQRRERGIVP
jgi:hypothetical protein